MKTLKNLMLIILFTGTVLFVKANDYYVTNYEVSPYQELRTSLQKCIIADFRRGGNYFYKNNINEFKSEVTIVFYVTDENQIQLVKIESRNGIAIEYIQQLFAKTIIKISDDYQYKKYKLTLKLDYRT